MVRLHNEDTNMILQDPNDSQHLYKMDLEYGKVVEEWKVHDDVPLHTFTASSKYAGMTDEQTLIGLSKTGLYRIDPRLAGSKLVDSEYKQYKSANDFSAAATTEAGHIAVASAKGDIRLYDRLGINAKTALPPMSAQFKRERMLAALALRSPLERTASLVRAFCSLNLSMWR
jgi:tRNA (guanine9-N1)-methyltransferase